MQSVLPSLAFRRWAVQSVSLLPFSKFHVVLHEAVEQRAAIPKSDVQEHSARPRWYGNRRTRPKWPTCAWLSMPELSSCRFHHAFVHRMIAKTCASAKTICTASLTSDSLTFSSKSVAKSLESLALACLRSWNQKWSVRHLNLAPYFRRFSG